MTSMTAETTATTANCPVGGCDADGQGHYDFAVKDATELGTFEVVQTHGCTVALTAGDSGGKLMVGIGADETRPGRKVGGDDVLPECEPIEGSEATFSEPTVHVFGRGNDSLDDLTAREARWLASALNRAADDLDDLTRPTVDAGHTVKVAREGYDGTIEQLAQDSGLSVERVQEIEAGGLMTHAEQRSLTEALVEGINRDRAARGQAPLS